jgi:hypothetical protein
VIRSSTFLVSKLSKEKSHPIVSTQYSCWKGLLSMLRYPYNPCIDWRSKWPVVWCLPIFLLQVPNKSVEWWLVSDCCTLYCVDGSKVIRNIDLDSPCVLVPCWITKIKSFISWPSFSLFGIATGITSAFMKLVQETDSASAWKMAYLSPRLPSPT